MSDLAIMAIVAAGAAALGGLYIFACSIPTLQWVGPVIVRGAGRTSRVALTFDDGPAVPFTEQILDILRDRGVKASFFLCGKNVEKFPEIARRIRQEGHQLGNHTYSHLFPYFRRGRFFAVEIDRTQDLIERLAGERPRVFRPPYGARWPSLYPVLRERRLLLVNWSDTGYDWTFGRERIIKATLKRLRPGGIILLHDGLETRPPRPIDQSGTVQALPAIIEAARTRGFEFVTLDELLSADPGRPAPVPE